MSFYWLFGTFHVFAIAAGALSLSSFEPSSSNSSFSPSLTERSRRTLVSANALGHFLCSNPNWKRLMWMTDVPRKPTVTTRAIFLRPTKLRWSRNENLDKMHQDPGGGFTRKHDRRGPNAANSLASWTNKACVLFHHHGTSTQWYSSGCVGGDIYRFLPASAVQPEGPCEMFVAVLVLIFCPGLSTSPVPVLYLSSTKFVSIVTLSPCTMSDEQWSEKLYWKPNSVWCLKF